MPTLHQFTEAAAPGDAITDHALQLRQWLRQMGYTSDIYTIHLSEELNRQVKPLSAYRPTPGEKYLIYHHGIGSRPLRLFAGWATRAGDEEKGQ